MPIVRVLVAVAPGLFKPVICQAGADVRRRWFTREMAIDEGKERTEAVSWNMKAGKLSARPIRRVLGRLLHLTT